MFIYIIIGVVFFIILIAIIENHKQLTLDNFIIKINEATKDIEILLEKKIELLSKISKSINKNEEQKILSNISKIKNKKLDMFELENQLYNLKKELDNYIEDNNLTFEENIENLIKKLENTELELKSLKLYYNKEAEIYNNHIKKITYIFLKMIKKHNEKYLFSIQKEIEFEILKNDNR